MVSRASSAKNERFESLQAQINDLKTTTQNGFDAVNVRFDTVGASICSIDDRVKGVESMVLSIKNSLSNLAAKFDNLPEWEGSGRRSEEKMQQITSEQLHVPQCPSVSHKHILETLDEQGRSGSDQVVVYNAGQYNKAKKILSGKGVWGSIFNIFRRNDKARSGADLPVCVVELNQGLMLGNLCWYDPHMSFREISAETSDGEFDDDVYFGYDGTDVYKDCFMLLHYPKDGSWHWGLYQGNPLKGKNRELQGRAFIAATFEVISNQ